MGRTPYKGLNTMILGVSDITALTNDQVASLNAGQVVLEDNESGQKLFKVTSKTADKMSLVFTDHEKIKEVKYAYQLVHSQTWRDKINSCFGARLTEDGKGVILTADEVNSIYFKEVANYLYRYIPEEEDTAWINGIENTYIIYNNNTYLFDSTDDSVWYLYEHDSIQESIVFTSIQHNNINSFYLTYSDEEFNFAYPIYWYGTEIVNAFKESTITLTPTQLNDDTYSYLSEQIEDNYTNQLAQSVIEYNGNIYNFSGFEDNEQLVWQYNHEQYIDFDITENKFINDLGTGYESFIDSITIFNASYIVDNILPDLEANTPDPEGEMMWLYQETVESGVSEEDIAKTVEETLANASSGNFVYLICLNGSGKIVKNEIVIPDSSNANYYTEIEENNLNIYVDDISGCFPSYIKIKLSGGDLEHDNFLEVYWDKKNYFQGDTYREDEPSADIDINDLTCDVQSEDRYAQFYVELTGSPANAEIEEIEFVYGTMSVSTN